MLVPLKRVFRPLIRKIRVFQARKYQGIHLPITRSNEQLSDDQAFLDSAYEQIAVLRQHIALSGDTHLLDFGCGQGRLALGLIQKVPESVRYVGIDTDQDAIHWCRRWIQRFHPGYIFKHVPAYNALYNPTSSGRSPLPLDSGTMDIVFLNSVFSHMLKDDVEFYLAEIGRVLKSGGLLYTTAFIESGVPDVEENPEGYLDKESTLPLHRVRYEKDFFLNLVRKAGMDTIKFDYRGIQRTQQSVVIAKKV